MWDTHTDDAGRVRPIAGKLRYTDPPEVGTIMGPNTGGEFLAVIGHRDGWTLFGFATVPEQAAVVQRHIEGEPPRSLTERHPHDVGRRPWGAARP